MSRILEIQRMAVIGVFMILYLVACSISTSPYSACLYRHLCVCVLITAGQTQLGLVSEVCMQSHSIETGETVVVASALVQTYFWSCSGD